MTRMHGAAMDSNSFSLSLNNQLKKETWLVGIIMASQALKNIYLLE